MRPCSRRPRKNPKRFDSEERSCVIGNEPPNSAAPANTGTPCWPIWFAASSSTSGWLPRSRRPRQPAPWRRKCSRSAKRAPFTRGVWPLRGCASTLGHSTRAKPSARRGDRTRMSSASCLKTSRLGSKNATAATRGSSNSANARATRRNARFWNGWTFRARRPNRQRPRPRLTQPKRTNKRTRVDSPARSQERAFFLAAAEIPWRRGKIRVGRIPFHAGLINLTVMNSAKSSALAGSGPWWRALNSYHWFVLTVAALGWLFDTMDQQLFNLARVPAMKALLKPGEEVALYGGYATSIFLIGWATGGLTFGVLGDRIGRVKTMIWTILIYSICTGLSALSVGFWDFAFYRFITGLGVGGEFAVGVSLVAEVMPNRARPFALGLLQALSAIGNVTAALISIVLGHLEQTGHVGSAWRVMFG